MTEKNSKIYEFGDFRLDAAEQILRLNGENVTLTPKVFDLLVVLVENQGHLLSKDELIKALWAESFVEEANLNVTISALRKVLGETPTEHRFIETVSRRGYRFVANVQEVSERQNKPFEVEKIVSEADTISFEFTTKRCTKCHKVYTDGSVNFCLDDGEVLVSDKPKTDEFISKTTAPNFPQKKVAFYALGGLAIVLIGFLVWKFAFQSAKTEVSNIKTIAVLPFKPLTKEKTDEALEMGMGDALVTKLSSLQQITVRPTSSVSKFSAIDTDPIAAGRELQVEAVLDGKIQRADNKIRVSVQLLRVSDGAVLWAGNFDDFFTNIFAMQDSISEKMATSLALKLSGKEKELLTKRFTENTDAYALYLQGRYFHEQISAEGSRKALDFYEQAVQKDPEFALAYAWMTGALIHIASLNTNPIKEQNLQKARFVAAKAIQIDPNLSDAHEALATIKYVLDWNFAEADAEFKKAIELDPKNADVRNSYASLLSELKRHDEAVREIEIATQIDPITMYIQNQAISVLTRARRYDEAIARAQKAIELKPDNQQAHNQLIRLYFYKSMPAEANAALKKYLEIFPNANPQFLDALVYQVSGQKNEAEKNLRELIGKYKEGESCYKYALYYILSGDKDHAIEFLEKSFAQREAPILLIDVDPDWDGIRSDPRFQNLVRRIGLPQ